MLFKGIDHITGGTIEAPVKKDLLEELNIRFEAYKEAFAYEGKNPFIICIKGVYYLGVK